MVLNLLSALYFLSIALGVGRKIVPVISTPFSMFFLYFLFFISYSGPAERGNKEHFRISEILLIC